MRRRVTVIGLVAGVLVLCAALQPILLPWPSSVTTEASERIKDGMTQAEVEKLLGGPPGDYRTRPTWVGTTRRSAADLRPGVKLTWLGDQAEVMVTLDAGGKVADKLFLACEPAPVSFLELIRWRLGRLKDRWFPPSLLSP